MAGLQKRDYMAKRGKGFHHYALFCFTPRVRETGREKTLARPQSCRDQSVDCGLFPWAEMGQLLDLQQLRKNLSHCPFAS